MDQKLAEFHFMGIFDIYREAYKVTVSWKKIFSQIALHRLKSALALNAINQSNLQNLDLTPMGNPKYTGNLKTRFASEMIIFNVSKAIYGICSVILSLFMTSAVVYTVACVYCSKDITFKKVMSAVPKLWKRLMITFLWFLLIQFVYIFIMSIVVALLMFLLVVSGILSVDKLAVKSTSNMPVVGMILAILFMIGFIYISFIWYMAAVVSILEDIRGIKAIKKAKNLIKGKIWIVFVTYILLQICNTSTLYAFSSLVVHEGSLAMVFRVSYGIFCLVLQGIFIHFGLVIQTIIYFVCKSHHKENIDKSSLGDHLDGYHLGQYVPLSKDEDIQLAEEFKSTGIFDIYREAYKIAFALILPLAFILLAQIEIAELLSNKIFSNLKSFDDNLHSQVYSDLIIFYVFTAISMLFTYVLSLLPTSAIVYTVACVYYSKDISFKKVMSVVPKVWKRLMITFLWKFFILFVYNFIIVLVTILLAIFYFCLSKILSVHIHKLAVIIFGIPMMIFIMIGAMCVTLVWFLASVISILEDVSGIEAMKRGKNLIKGKIWISWRIYFTFQSYCAAVQFAFRYHVVHGDSLALVVRLSLGICYLLLLVIFIYFGIVTQTIVYFVCKSHHKENIDKCSLADHLDGYYLGNYVPLNEDENLHLGGNFV
ncbi:hypothetical protein MKW92_053225 [Papaver armeniacum]|nr:hypothetical protein MKW92_053225 [Papaver armeniacum]